MRPRLAARRRRRASWCSTGRRQRGQVDLDASRADTDIVTEFDRASERLIVDGLLAERPDDAIVGEEGTDSAGASGVALADRPDRRHHQLPLRPARLRRLDRRVDRRTGTLAGAVYVPATDELFAADRRPGRDAERRRRSAAATTADAGQALVATGFCYLVERRATRRQRFAELIGQGPRHPPLRRGRHRPVLRRRRPRRRATTSSGSARGTGPPAS